MFGSCVRAFSVIWKANYYQDYNKEYLDDTISLANKEPVEATLGDVEAELLNSKDATDLYKTYEGIIRILEKNNIGKQCKQSIYFCLRFIIYSL